MEVKRVQNSFAAKRSEYSLVQNFPEGLDCEYR
jgi:hypothetical protein